MAEKDEIKVRVYRTQNRVTISFPLVGCFAPAHGALEELREISDHLENPTCPTVMLDPETFPILNALRRLLSRKLSRVRAP